MSLITEAAPAKINLTLHVTGLRGDGYHLLDSLVVFCDVSDRIIMRPALARSLTLAGPFAHEVPPGDDNLVMRAVDRFGGDAVLAVSLQKNLPVASGLGGGSADAAAAIRAILRLTSDDGAASPDVAAVLSLGADVPVCLASRPARMRGVGEMLDWLGPLPETYITLVNPRVAVSTQDVFRALETKTNPAMPDLLPRWPDARALAEWLATMRNDLESPARTIAPVIGHVLAHLEMQPGALLSRMSGSGATCFALFGTRAGADNAARAIARAQPYWWTAAGAVLGVPRAGIS